MNRAPKVNDAFECVDTKAVYSVVGVRPAKPELHPLSDEPRWAIAMVCVIAPSVDARLAGGGPTLGDMHHVSGTWESLEDGYTLLTA